MDAILRTGAGAVKFRIHEFVHTRCAGVVAGTSINVHEPSANQFKGHTREYTVQSRYTLAD